MEKLRLQESREKNQPWKKWGPYLSERQWDNGAGLGASHQTGWTGLIAKMIELYGSIDAEKALNEGKKSGFFKKGDDASKKEALKPLTENPVLNKPE